MRHLSSSMFLPMVVVVLVVVLVWLGSWSALRAHVPIPAVLTVIALVAAGVGGGWLVRHRLKRDLDEARARQRDLERLCAAGQALLAAEPRQITNTIVAKALVIAGADWALLFQVGGRAQFLQTVSSAGRVTRDPVGESSHRTERRLGALAVTERRTVWSDDAPRDPRFGVSADGAERATQGPLGACVAVPLLVDGGAVFGSLALGYAERRAFTAADLKLISDYGVQTAVALERASALERSAVTARRGTALGELSRRLAEATSEAAVLDETVRAVRELLRAEYVDVSLRDDDGQTLRVRAGYGWQRGSAVSAAAGSLAVRCLERNEPLAVEDLRADARWEMPAHAVSHGVRATIVAPLNVAGEPVGVLGAYFVEPRDLDDDARRSMAEVAARAQAALEKAGVLSEGPAGQPCVCERAATGARAGDGDPRAAAADTRLATVAHQLNNPLTSIVLCAQVIKQQPALPDLVQRRVEAIEQEAKRAAAIIKGTLSIRESSPPAAAVLSAAPGRAHTRILLVDDEDQLRDIMGDVLADAGHDTVGAATGREAIAALERERFDLVLLDLKLPDLDGRAVWRWIVGQAPAMASRVVFMTGDVTGPENERFLRETGRPVLSKPASIERVRQIVDDAILAAA